MVNRLGSLSHLRFPLRVEVAVAAEDAVVVALLLLVLRRVEHPLLVPEEPAARIRKPGNFSLFNVQLSFAEAEKKPPSTDDK